MKNLWDYAAIFALFGGLLTILFGVLLSVALWSWRKVRAAEQPYLSEPWGDA